MAWQLQEAKQKFSEMVRWALSEGPQFVTRHGDEVVVVLSAKAYRELSKAEPKRDFKSFLVEGPDFEPLTLERDRSPHHRAVSYLLDTNVLSELRRPRGDENVKRWFAEVGGDELFLSVLVLGEIKRGVVRLSERDPVQAAVYESWLKVLKTDYRERVLELDSEIAKRWGVLNAHEPLPVIDGLLAATALVHGLTLVTRNTKDVARSGVATLNLFEIA